MVKVAQSRAAAIESLMLANHVGIARPNVVAKDLLADIVRTSRYNVITPTAREIE